MPTKPEANFPAVFVRLRAILEQHAPRFTVTDDSPTRYCLEGGLHPKHKRPVPLAWVQIGKAYVSFHHMGFSPQLTSGLSAPLRARMQGETCLNFKAVDESLFSELAAATSAGFDALRRLGMLP